MGHSFHYCSEAYRNQIELNIIKLFSPFIVRTITISLLGEIEISSLQRAKRKATENISSYEYLLRGKERKQRELRDNKDFVRRLRNEYSPIQQQYYLTK